MHYAPLCADHVFLFYDLDLLYFCDSFKVLGQDFAKKLDHSGGMRKTRILNMER